VRDPAVPERSTVAGQLVGQQGVGSPPRPLLVDVGVMPAAVTVAIAMVTAA
jgi:hypothetical protein